MAMKTKNLFPVRLVLLPGTRISIDGSRCSEFRLTRRYVPGISRRICFRDCDSDFCDEYFLTPNRHVITVVP